MDIPIYNVTLDDNLDYGMDFISLVENPAIGERFIALNDQEVKFNFNQDKQELVGPLLIPDMKILRDEEAFGGKIYVKFSSDVISEILQRFQKQDYSNNINLYHSNRTVSAFVMEMWLKEFAEDKSNAYGFSLPIGTLFAKVKVEDSEFWRDYVKEGLVKGFSIELLSGVQKQMFENIDSDLATLNKIESILKKVL